MLILAGEGGAQFHGFGGQVQREGEELCVVASSLILGKMKGQHSYPLEIAAMGISVSEKSLFAPFAAIGTGIEGRKERSFVATP